MLGDLILVKWICMGMAVSDMLREYCEGDA
jgi:hypothetical protein